MSIAFASYHKDNPSYSYSKNSFVMYPEWIYDTKWIIEKKKMYLNFRTVLRFMKRYGWSQTFLNCVENSLRRKALY